MKDKSKNSRSFGYGSKGKDTPKTIQKKATIFQKLKYSFDNSMSKSGAFVAYLALAAFIIALLMTGLRYILEESSTDSFINRYWDSLIKILKVGKGKTWSERGISIIFWSISVAISGTVIGFITNAIRGVIQKLKKGKSPIIENNHILILGWSERVFPILQQLAVANENQKDALVVIFSKKSREEMEDVISDRSDEFGKMRIISRCGNPENSTDLKRLNVDSAKSIIILDEDNQNDSAVVSSVLAVLSITTNPDISIIAEVDDPNHTATLEHVYKGNVLCVDPKSITAQVAAQACRQSGLAAVILDFLDFEGAEIYFSFIPELKNKTYYKALFSFEDCAVIGYVDTSGKTHINPEHNTILDDLDEIIVVAFDDDKIIYSDYTIDENTIQVPENIKIDQKSEHILIIGWSSMGLAILNQLVSFLPPGSSVHIFAQEKYSNFQNIEHMNFAEVNITYSTYDGNLEALNEVAKSKHYDAIIVLGYRDKLKVEEADTQTILTMLQINRLFEEEDSGVSHTRLLSEILDSRKATLARFASAGELVLSDNLAALVIAQLAENPGLESVYTDIFTPKGAFISLKPIERYSALDVETDFYQLVAIASKLGESAIGYRVLANTNRNATEGVELNPRKTKKFVPKKGDSLLVVCTQ